MSETGLHGRAAILTSVHPPLDVRVFHREARSLAAAGLEVILIAPGAAADPRDGVTFRSLPAWGGRAARPLRWPLVLWHALRSRGDVYHFHDPELLPWGLLVHWLSRKPVIYDSHEYFPETIADKHWIPRRLRRAVAGLARFAERWVAGRLSAVVAVTEDMADRFSEVQPRTVLVRNFVAPPDISYPPESRAPVVVYAGLMNINRGLSILYETACAVRDACPEAEFHILGPVEWFGADDDRRRSAGEWEAVGVRFLGTVPPAEVAPLLVQAAVGWLPLDPDVRNAGLAWPTKLAEYMILGLPVVASDLPIPARTIRAENCGEVVAGLDAVAHARAITGLLLDERRARRLGESGRRAALAKFTWPREAEKLQSLYGELLSTS